MDRTGRRGGKPQKVCLRGGKLERPIETKKKQGETGTSVIKKKERGKNGLLNVQNMAGSSASVRRRSNKGRQAVSLGPEKFRGRSPPRKAAGAQIRERKKRELGHCYRLDLKKSCVRLKGHGARRGSGNSKETPEGGKRSALKFLGGKEEGSNATLKGNAAEVKEWPRTKERVKVRGSFSREKERQGCESGACRTIH